ncbi:MAG: Maf family protein [Cyanobium sp.]
MLVLASASPARRRLLEQAAIPHRVRLSGIDENAIADPDPRRLVLRLAEAKACAVAEALAAEGTFAAEGTAEAAVDAVGGVLGCDSLLVFEGEVFGKPADAAEAVERWRRMAGGSAELHTGHCLLGVGGGSQRETVSTRVHFAALSAAEIEAYVATGEPLACAGGFALEGRGGALVERIDGCFSNVIGLSLPLLRRWLA